MWPPLIHRQIARDSRNGLNALQGIFSIFIPKYGMISGLKVEISCAEREMWQYQASLEGEPIAKSIPLQALTP